MSLAMIEQSLLDRFGFSIPAIGDFFRGAVRQTAVRTTASITFEYRPGTQPINPRLLAEEDRKELESMEKERLSRLASAGGEAAGIPIVTSVIPTTEDADAPADSSPNAAARERDGFHVPLGTPTGLQFHVLNDAEASQSAASDELTAGFGSCTRGRRRPRRRHGQIGTPQRATKPRTKLRPRRTMGGGERPFTRVQERWQTVGIRRQPRRRLPREGQSPLLGGRRYRD